MKSSKQLWANGTSLSILSHCKLSNTRPYRFYFPPKVNLVHREDSVQNNSLPQLADIFTPCISPSNYGRTIHIVNSLPVHANIIKYEEQYTTSIPELHLSINLPLYLLKFVRSVWRQELNTEFLKRECPLRAIMSCTVVKEQKTLKSSGL